MIDIRLGDCLDVLRTLPDGMARTCVTSPPYYSLRDYGVEGQIGLEDTPDAYVARLVEVFREVRRVLADDGTLWLNLGDSYNVSPPGNRSPMSKSGLNGAQTSASYRARLEETQQRQQEHRGLVPGLGPKQLLGIPWRVAFALQADGWTLRSDIIWAKPNPMPESVRDRPTKAHEYVFLLSKRPRYYYDAEAVREESHTPVRPCGGRAESHAAKSVGPHARGVDGFNHQYADTDRPWGDPAGRNARSVWTITPRPFKGAHFATFPPELAERCIKAGSSERGKCPECGAAWERVVESERVATRPGVNSKVYVEPPVHPDSPVRRHNGTVCGNRDPQRHTTTTTTTGWRPTCDHGHDPVPDVVLDPFAGAGTVGLVCQRLGRHHVGIELNPAYREMAMARIAADASRTPLLAGA